MSIGLVFDTRKLQKYVKIQGNWALRGQNHVLCYFFRNMGLDWPILYQSWVKNSFIGLVTNLNDLKAILYWFWDQEAAKIRQNARKLSFEGLKSCFMLFLPKIWDLGGPYCTNLEYKLVLLYKKTIWMMSMSIRLVYDTRKLQKYVIMQGNWALRG